MMPWASMGCPTFVRFLAFCGQSGSYSATKQELMPGIEHRWHKGLNNRAENSHQPTRSSVPSSTAHAGAGGAHGENDK